MRADHTEIYEQFMDLCPGVQLPSHWDYLGADDDCGVVTDDIDHTIELLQSEFELDWLLESRLLVREDGDGQLCLNPRLLTEDQIVVCLRNEQDEIFDLITSAGSLSGREVLLLLRKDTVTRRLLRNHDHVFLMFSMMDVILFRAIGLAAMHAADIAYLRRGGLQRLLWLVGGYSHGPIPRKQSQLSWEGGTMFNESGYMGEEKYAPNELEVVICSFCLNSLNRAIPEGMTRVARHLARAEKYLEIHFGALNVWWPTEDEMSNLAYRNELRAPEILREFLVGEHEFFGVEHFVDANRPPAEADSFVRTMEELLQALDEVDQHRESQHHVKREREAVAKFEAALDKTVFKPLLESAMALPDPSMRPARIQHAHLSRMLHSLMPRMHSELKRSQNAGSGSLSDESRKTIKMLTEQMIKLMKEERAASASEET